jgi:serine/threonine-protein kinase
MSSRHSSRSLGGASRVQARLAPPSRVSEARRAGTQPAETQVSEPLAPGVLLDGRFRIRRKIATGGFGEVWEGDQCATGMRVALKALLPETAKLDEVVLRFKREAELLARVRSDRVARLVDFFVDPTYGPILVIELIDGRSLAEMVAEQPLSVEDAVDLGVEIAMAVCELHQARILHRDLKPGNVIVQPCRNGRTRVVLVDLGASREMPSEEASDDELTAITRAHCAVGTLAYMAPEQLSGASDVNETADVYSLGAILFRLVAGHSLFKELSQASLARRKLLAASPRLETGRADAVARGFEAVVSRALDGDPAARYATVDVMLSELLRLRNLPKAGGESAGAGVARRGGGRRGGTRAWHLAAWAAMLAVPLALGGAALGLSCARIVPLPSAGALAHPLANPLGAAARDEAVPSSQGPLVCASTGALGAAASATSPPTTSIPALASPQRTADARKARQKQAQEAALLKAIREAVAEEEYMTVIVPEPIAVTRSAAGARRSDL